MLPVLGLALLLLISPCKVRNFIQAELGIPQTEVTNKSKTALNKTSCSTIAVSEIAFTVVNSSTQNFQVLAINNIAPSINTIAPSNKPVDFNNRVNHSVSIIPLYILYQNFQVYL